MVWPTLKEDEMDGYYWDSGRSERIAELATGQDKNWEMMVFIDRELKR